MAFAGARRRIRFGAPKAQLAAVVVALAVVGAQALGAAAANGGKPLTRQQYLSKVALATNASANAENKVTSGLKATATTAAQIRASFKAWGRTETRLGKGFAAVTPPARAKQANKDLAHAEQLYGKQLVALAAKLPATKAGIAKLLNSIRPPSGGPLLDRALTELQIIGFTG